MGKRKQDDEEEKIRKKLEKWKKRMRKIVEDKEERSNTPTISPPIADDPGPDTEPSTSRDNISIIASDEEEVPEELLHALGPEGADAMEMGDPIHQHLASRWQNIMRDGLTKETRQEIIKKYPGPENFQVTAPILNPELKIVMSEIAIKRDNRFIWRQNQMGNLLTAIGKVLTNVMKGSINSKDIVEHLSNAAKIGAELYHQDSMSRRYFALSGTSKTVKEAIKNERADKMLFGQNCTEKIKLAQTIQKTGAQIKERKKNFRSPLPAQQNLRSGLNLPTRNPSKTNYHPKPQRQLQGRTVLRRNQQRKRSPPPVQRPRYHN